MLFANSVNPNLNCFSTIILFHKILQHSGAGKLLSIINIDPNFQVICHGWTEKEELVLLYHNGILEFYDILGRNLPNRTLNILPNSGLSKINAKIYSMGLVGLLLNRGTDKRNEIIEPKRKANPILDSTSPRPVASVKLRIIGGSKTCVNPQRKLQIDKIRTKVRSPFCFLSQLYASVKSK